MQSEMRELIDAAAKMRYAYNKLWCAQNQEYGHKNEPPQSVREAEQQHSEAFLELVRAEYYAEKALSRCSD